MQGAGFNGICGRYRRKGPRVASPFDVTLSGLNNGTAINATSIGYTLSSGTADAQRWQTSVSGGVWIDIGGATGANETVDFLDGQHDDNSLLRVGVTQAGLEVFSNPARMVYAPPSAVLTLSDQTFLQGTGTTVLDVSMAFDGDAISYRISPLDGVDINASGGEISFDTDVMSLQDTTTVSVTASNSGGEVSATFSVTVQEEQTLSILTILGEPVVIVPGGGDLTISLSGGEYEGVYARRVTDNAPLTPQLISAGSVPIVRPLVEDGLGASAFLSVGDVISLKPGLWLTSQSIADARTYKWQRDGVDIAGATALDYTIAVDDLGATLTPVETLNSVALTGVPYFVEQMLVYAPTDLGPKLHTWLDFTDISVMSTDAARTIPVISDADPVRGINDKSGSNRHYNAPAMTSDTMLIWNAADGQIEAAGDNSMYLRALAPLSGATTSMEIYIAIKTTDINWMLIGASEQNFYYVGRSHANLTNSPHGASSFVGTPITSTNGVDTAITEAQALGIEWGTDVPLIAGARNIDLTRWQTDGLSVQVLNGWGNFFPINPGSITHYVITTQLTAQERFDLIAWMQGNLPS